MKMKYTALNQTIHNNLHIKECAEKGKAWIQNAVLMRQTDYEYIAMRMFEKEEHYVRSIFILDVQLTGRVSEVRTSNRNDIPIFYEAKISAYTGRQL